MAEDMIKTRIKDAPINLLIEQFLNAYILGDSSASGTGKILGKTIVDYILSKNFDSICETQAELLSAITSDTVRTILWKGNTTLIDFVASAGTFKLIYCQHYSLLGKNSTLVSPAGKNITIYGDINCAAPVAGGYSWTLNSTATSYIKCKWIKNSGTTGKVICEVGTVLYERLESGLILETNGTVGSESYINQEFWDNTNDGSGFLGDGKVFRSSDDSVRGFFADKIAESEWIHKYQIIESGIKKLQLGLANPDYFVKGNTIYGGSIVDNLNTLAHNGWVTCYGAAVGAPNSNNSWFVEHQNSNAGTLYAYQKATAFSDSLIIYDRVKNAGVWQPWALRTAGGDGSATMMETMCLGAAITQVDILAGSDTQWTATGTRIAPFNPLTLSASSKIKISLPQPVSGKHFIFGLYSYNETTHLQTRKASTGVLNMPASSSDFIGELSSLVSPSFVNSEMYYAVLFTDANGARARGAGSTGMNFLPYTSGTKSNLGVLTAAPDTFTFENETGGNIFMRVIV